MVLILLITYLTILFFLLLSYILITKHLNKILQQIYYLLDAIFFEIALFLNKNKEYIIKYEDFVEYLFYPKRKFIYGFHQDIIDFNNFRKEFEKQIEESEKILHKNILNPDLYLQLDDYFKIGIKLYKIKNFLRLTLCILTFGIFCIFN